jgi:hypothetical protein
MGFESGLKLLGSASGVAGTIGMCHHTWFGDFIFLTAASLNIKKSVSWKILVRSC